MIEDPLQISKDEQTQTVHRQWVPEVPVALEYNGLSYAVMMATPADLQDFALGFAVAEGLATRATDLAQFSAAEVDAGWIVRATLAGVGEEKLQERVRNRVAESSCGLCGIENLAALAKPLPPVAPHVPIAPAAIFRALTELRGLQPLGTATRAAHAAALAAQNGRVRIVREDVGRHNAMDKLVGGALLADADGAADGNANGIPGLGGGFILSTARCSYEIVEKAVRAGATTLVTISLPTTMAINRARDAGLTLYCLARDDSVLLVNRGR